MTVGLDEAARVRDGAERRTAVAVEHVHPRISLHGILEGRELRFQRRAVEEITFAFPLDDRLGEALPRDHLLHGIHGQHVRHALVVADGGSGPDKVAGDAALRIAGKIEREIERRAALQIAEVDARLAPALHRHHQDHAARPLGAGRRPAGAAEARACPARARGRSSSGPTLERARARRAPARRSPLPATRASWEGRRPCRAGSRARRRSPSCASPRTPCRTGLRTPRPA